MSGAGPDPTLPNPAFRLGAELVAALSEATGGTWQLESADWRGPGVLSLSLRLSLRPSLPLILEVREAAPGPHTVRWSAGLSLTSMEQGLEHRVGAELLARVGQAILDAVRPAFGLAAPTPRAPAPAPAPTEPPRPRPEPVYAARPSTDEDAPVLDHPAAPGLARVVREATRPPWTLLRVEDLPGPGLLLRCRTPFGPVELALKPTADGPQTLLWRDGLDLSSSVVQLDRLIPDDVDRLARAVHAAGATNLRPPAPTITPPSPPPSPRSPPSPRPPPDAPSQGSTSMVRALATPAKGARGRGGRRAREERGRLASSLLVGLTLGLVPAWLLEASAAGLAAAGVFGLGAGLAVGLRVRERLFGVDRWRDFEDPFDPARREQASTKRVLEALRLERDARVLDVGAGAGFFSFLIASRLGNQGRVFALENDAGRARAIQEVVDEYGINTVEVIRRSAFQTETLALAVDAILIVNVYLFDRAQPERTRALLRSLGSLLRPGGRLVIHSDFVFTRAPERMFGCVYPAAHDEAEGDAVAGLATAGLVLESLAPVTDVPCTYDNASPGYLLVLRREA